MKNKHIDTEDTLSNFKLCVPCAYVFKNINK
jgi:hypothetical protein